MFLEGVKLQQAIWHWMVSTGRLPVSLIWGLVVALDSILGFCDFS